jgi:predicted dehydrogenase
MTAAAEVAAERGIRSMVGFNYRRVPAIVLARKLIADGRVGTIRHVRAQYLQDWIVDPQFPLVWRLQRDKAGSGALGDIGAHIIDLTQYVTGQRLTGVSALTETFVPERPLPTVSAGLSASTDGGDAGPAATGPVTVDDCAAFLARFGDGAVGVFEATRFATGRKNSIRIEVNGSAASLAFDFQRMNELDLYDNTEPAETAGFRTIQVTEPSHPYLAAWWPPGHPLGYEHTFTHEVVDLVHAIASEQDPTPSFADGLLVQRVLAAVESSAAANSCWQEVRP